MSQEAGQPRFSAVRPARLAPRLLRAAVRIGVLVVLYQIYAYARNRHGIASQDAGDTARRHAGELVRIQTSLGLPPEAEVQRLVLDQEWLLRVFGAFYGSAHFLVTVGVVLLLAVRRPDRFDRRAGTLALSTFVGVAVFALYPVMPPRLMTGAQATVDTLATVGGVWSYDHGVLERISDPYAALPSLHLAWATWVSLVLWELGARSRRRRAWRAAAVAHLVLTALAVHVTGNHWYLDTLAGTVLVVAVAAAQTAVSRARERRRARPEQELPQRQD